MARQLKTDNHKQLVRRKGAVMSLIIGSILGFTFTSVNILMNFTVRHMPMPVQAIPWSLISGVLLSTAVSGIWGSIISIKERVDNYVARKHIDPFEEAKKVDWITTTLGNLWFTPINCFFGMWYGMETNFGGFPEPFQFNAINTRSFAKIIEITLARFGYLITFPGFWMQYFSVVIFDLIVALPILHFWACPVAHKLSNKFLKV